ncbi:sugar ABC transporter ATP-binding protein [Bifidobacterium lemurum]|uniref:Sugar ABC transporter ATP-binding protein n=2 Tax=Bifidobacterium lemurum TaxID=1603886 RepID=A0A261FU45_9BIFI|nr:ATP-binding cassette domain-containing protein [Bifidobacterium lemurum]OZG62712.1 sugar ABC transporter ATP-binding protein [Bifidobacterium lemurum]QOL34571.1 sugar ABC transporter ATP-binding protein [Bifidobacterium lemurum]
MTAQVLRSHNAYKQRDFSRRAVFGARGLRKSYGSVDALDGVDIDVYEHEIMAVVGDNGAGKSTLVKILSGLEQPDDGYLLREGEEVSFQGIKEANDSGVCTIFQNPAMCPAMDVSDNVFMGRECMRGPFVDKRRMVEGTRNVLKKLGSPLSPTREVRGLSEGERKTLTFAQAMLKEPEVLILDEPTSSLSVIQTGEVLNQMLSMREDGKSLIVVCHNLTDVFAVSDRICVMRHGCVVAVLNTRETTYETVVGYMAGVPQRR